MSCPSRGRTGTQFCFQSFTWVCLDEVLAGILLEAVLPTQSPVCWDYRWMLLGLFQECGQQDKGCQVRAPAPCGAQSHTSLAKGQSGKQALKGLADASLLQSNLSLASFSQKMSC